MNKIWTTYFIITNFLTNSSVIGGDYDINMMALMPFTGRTINGDAYNHTLRMAIKDIEERGLLPGYRLKFTPRNSGVRS